MKIGVFFAVVISCLSSHAFSQKLSVSLNINGSVITGEKYFFIKGEKGVLLLVSDNKIILPDSITYPYKLLMIYKSHKVILHIPYSDVEYLKIYYDTRKIHNQIDSVSQIKYRQKKLQHQYLLDYGNGMLSLNRSSAKVDYLKKYHIDF